MIESQSKEIIRIRIRIINVSFLGWRKFERHNSKTTRFPANRIEGATRTVK